MATASSLGSTFNTTSGTHTVVATPALSDLIVILAANTGNTSTAAPTDNNTDGLGTYTLVNTAVKATSADTMKMWVRNYLVGSATSTTFTHAPGTSTGGGLQVFKITGMERTGLSAVVRQSAIESNKGATTPAPVLGVAALTGNPLIGAVFNATNPAGMTAPASWTESIDVGYTAPVTGVETVFISSGFTGTTVTWGSASASAMGDIVAEFDTSPAPRSLQYLNTHREAMHRSTRW